MIRFRLCADDALVDELLGRAAEPALQLPREASIHKGLPCLDDLLFAVGLDEALCDACCCVVVHDDSLSLWGRSPGWFIC